MPELRLRALAPDEPANWPDSLTLPATFTVLDSWTGLSRLIYKYPVHRLETEGESGVTGILSMVEIKHPLLGHYLTTSPFGSYGGFAYSSLEVRDALLEEARNLIRRLGVAYVNVRFYAGEQATPPEGWVQSPLYATFLVDLAHDSETLMASYSSDHRNHIRKSLKKGFSMRFGNNLDLLDDSYEGLARSMHELGSPYHSKDYLRTMAESLGDALEFTVLYAPNGSLAGAGVFIVHGDTVTNLHANILRAHRADYAGEFLYWKAIERYGQHGLKVFDLGRSLLGSGNETFKMKWKPRRHLLAYWYALKPGGEVPHMNQTNSGLRAASSAWKRVPTFIVRPLGPFFIRGLA